MDVLEAVLEVLQVFEDIIIKNIWHVISPFLWFPVAWWLVGHFLKISLFVYCFWFVYSSITIVLYVYFFICFTFWVSHTQNRCSESFLVVLMEHSGDQVMPGIKPRTLAFKVCGLILWTISSTLHHFNRSAYVLHSCFRYVFWFKFFKNNFWDKLLDQVIQTILVIRCSWHSIIEL